MLEPQLDRGDLALVDRGRVTYTGAVIDGGAKTDRAPHEALVFGVVSGDPLARVSLASVCQAVSRATERSVMPVILDSYGELAKRMESGKMALAWAPPLVAHRLIGRHLAVPITCPRRPGGLYYHSVVFTRARGRLKDVAELRDVRAAWVDTASLSGFLLARRWCERNAPSRPFSSEVYVKTHSAVARAVLSGEADIGATYANIEAKSGRIVDAGWSEVGASNDDVRVLAKIGPVPADAIVLASRFAEPLRESCARALMTLEGPAIAAARSLFRAEHFELPPPDYRELLRRLGE